MLVQISGWPVFLADGEAYLRCARQAAAKGKAAFTPTILYNLIAMAIEKFIMAFLMCRGDLAQNHTMADLADAFERHAGPQPQLREELLFIDSFQSICEMDHSLYRDPSEPELNRMFATVTAVKEIVLSQLPESVEGHDVPVS